MFGGKAMSGFIIYWSKEYIDKIKKCESEEKLSVVFSGYSTKLPSLKSIKVGDIVFPVTLYNNQFLVMSRLTINKIEPAFDYLMRETGKPYNCMFPDNFAVKHEYSQQAGKLAGKTYYSMNSGHYDNIEDVPENTTILILEDLKDIPHGLSQEPPDILAAFALSGTDGAVIKPRIIPYETITTLKFGKLNDQKPLKTDKNGKIVNASLFGHARLMSEETYNYFDSLFD